MSLCVLSIDLATNVSVTSPHHNHAHCTQRVMCSIRSPHSEGYRLNMLTILRGLILLQSEENKEDNNSRRNFYEQGEAGNEAMDLTHKLQCWVFVGLRNPLVNIKLWDGDRNLRYHVVKEIQKEKNMNFFFSKNYTHGPLTVSVL